MKQGKLIRRAVSAALAGCMMFTLSAPALAESTDALMQLSTAAKSAVSVLDMQNDISESVTTMDLRNGSIIVSVENGQQYAEQKNIKRQISDLVVTTNNDETTNTLTIEGGTTAAKVTLHNVNIDASGAAVSVSGDVELIISGTNTLQSGWDHAGVEKADDNGTLTISGSGELKAYGGYWGAGIGSGSEKGCSNIVIESGTITAKGGVLGAGIGGGQLAAGQNITIRDGNVTAIPGSEAAGIGGGSRGDGRNITIEGGTVYAESGGGNGPAAAIGGGRWTGKGENIQITGGNVTLKTVDDDDIYIGNGQEEAKIDTSILLGTITKLDKDGKQVDEIVQDYGLEVGAEFTTPTRVTSKNYKDILENGMLSYDPTTQTLKSNSPIKRSSLKINAPQKDINLDGKDQIAVAAKLIVENARNVKVNSNELAAIMARYDTSTINCTGKVDIRSGGFMAVNGSLNIDDSSEVILSADSSAVTRSANITSNGDVTIESTDGRAAQNLTINKAEDVTISISDAERAVSENTKITASGTVILKNNAQGGRVGTVAFTQAGGKNYVYYTSEEPDAKLIDPRIHPLAEAAGSRFLRIEPRETYGITVKNGTAQVDDTTGLPSAFEGETITATAPEHDSSASFSKFEGWKLNKGSISEIVKENDEVVEIRVDEDGYIVDEHGEKIKEKIIRFKMPGEKVEMTAVYSVPAVVQDLPVIVTGGTINDTQDTLIRVKPGTKVTVKADAPDDEKASFHHWKVEMGTSADFGVTEGSLGSETETGTEEISFIMPKGAVRLTAVYSIPASVLRSTVTVTGGTAKSTLDEGSDIPAEIGTTVEITATPYDAEKYPGMEFVEWEIKYPDSFYEKFPDGIPENLQLKLDNAKSAATTFKMPVYPVKLIAHWSASPVAKPDPDEPLDEDFGVEPAPMDTTGGTIAAVAVGGAAIWGGYEIATRVILHNLLPEGAAIPANRGQLALLIWTEKGKPEPAAQPAFADITDAEQAKAAQWCVEQGLLDAREGKFESDGWMPKFKTIEIWNKAFPKK